MQVGGILPDLYDVCADAWSHDCVPPQPALVAPAMAYYQRLLIQLLCPNSPGI